MDEARPTDRHADTVCLAAACVEDQSAVAALSEHRGQGEVRDALRSVGAEFETDRSAAAARVQAHFEEELGVDTGGAGAAGIARCLSDALA